MFAKNVTSLLRSGNLNRNGFLLKNFLSTEKQHIVKIQSPDDFKKIVINSKVPVVVDFFATWCNPCKILTPRLESLITENKGKVILAKVDIDEHTDLALDYDVSSVPVLLSIKNGKIQQRLVGLQETDKLRKWIQTLTEEREQAKA